VESPWQSAAEVPVGRGILVLLLAPVLLPLLLFTRQLLHQGRLELWCRSGGSVRLTGGGVVTRRCVRA
jgi:hypothetical protein